MDIVTDIFAQHPDLFRQIRCHHIRGDGVLQDCIVGYQSRFDSGCNLGGIDGRIQEEPMAALRTTCGELNFLGHFYIFLLGV